MENELLYEFKRYAKIKSEKMDFEKLSPTTVLPLIYDGKIEFEETNTLKRLEKIDNSVEITNEILKNLDFKNSNISVLKFIFYELIANIYDHSKFNNAYVMGKSDGRYCEFGFIDDGISIPQSFKNNEYLIKNDSASIMHAINGLSTKNIMGYIERGTGLNNTINITVNGLKGSALIVSGCGLVHISKNKVSTKELAEKCIDGTFVSLRMDITGKIDIYKYLNQVKYE